MDELFYDSLDLLKRLIETPRVSRTEGDGATLVYDFLEAHGMKARRVNNNVWCVAGEFDPTRPTLLLNSHIDTVKPVAGWQRNPHQALIEDDRLYGLGSNDAGASLVSLAVTAIAMNDVERSYNIVFAASAEEEVSGRDGLSVLIPELPKIDVAIVGEPTGMNPAIAEKGLMVIDAVVNGVSGHAARGEGVNAIYRAIEMIERLTNIKFEKESPTLGPVKITVTGVKSGTQHNVVPDKCEVMIDVRTTDAYSNAETLELMREAVKDIDCTLTPRSLRLNPSGISQTHPLVQRLEMMGFTAFGSPTLSDQALMSWPSVKVGPGDSARSHTADEYIMLSELRQAQEIYRHLLTGLNL